MKKLAIAIALLAAPLLLALDNPIGSTKDATITCPASSGTPELLRVSGAASADAVLVVNDSTSLVRIGGVAVTATTGASLGGGGALGKAFAIEGRKTWCISDDATPVDVQILYGAR